MNIDFPAIFYGREGEDESEIKEPIKKKNDSVKSRFIVI